MVAPSIHPTPSLVVCLKARVVIGNDQVSDIPPGTSLELFLVDSPTWVLGDAYRRLFNLNEVIRLFVYNNNILDPESDLRLAALGSGQPTVLVHNKLSGKFNTGPLEISHANSATVCLDGSIPAAAASDVMRLIVKLAMRLPHVVEPLTAKEVGIGEALKEWGVRRLACGDVPIVTAREAEISIRSFQGCRYLDMDRCLARLSAAAYVQTHPVSGMVLLDFPWVCRFMGMATSIDLKGRLRCGDFQRHWGAEVSHTALWVSRGFEWLVRCGMAIPFGDKEGEFMVFGGMGPRDVHNIREYDKKTLLIGNGDPEEGLALDGVKTVMFLWAVVSEISNVGAIGSAGEKPVLLGAYYDKFTWSVRGATFRLAFQENWRCLFVFVSGPARHEVLLRVYGLLVKVLDRHPDYVSDRKFGMGILCARHDCMENNAIHRVSVGKLRQTGAFYCKGSCDRDLSEEVRGLENGIRLGWSVTRAAWIGTVARASLRKL